MRKTKYVLAPNGNVARDFARNNKLEEKEWVYVTESHRLRGIDSKTIEFVFLDGWWINSFYNKDTDDVVLHHTILGAKKTYL